MSDDPPNTIPSVTWIVDHHGDVHLCRAVYFQTPQILAAKNHTINPYLFHNSNFYSNDHDSRPQTVINMCHGHGSHIYRINDQFDRFLRLYTAAVHCISITILPCGWYHCPRVNVTYTLKKAVDNTACCTQWLHGASMFCRRTNSISNWRSHIHVQVYILDRP